MDAKTGQGPYEWMSVKQVAVALGVHGSAVYSLVASGDIACYRIGPSRGRIKFKPSDLDAYLELVRVGPKVKVPRPQARVPYIPRHPI